MGLGLLQLGVFCVGFEDVALVGLAEGFLC